MLEIVYWQGSQGVMPISTLNLIRVAPNVGTVFGMVVFGYLADVLGRRKMYGINLFIILSATLAESLCSSSPAISIIGVIVFWRVIMGIGVGGDCPLSAVITSEMAHTNWRGAMIGAVFTMQGFGQFATALMVLIMTIRFKDTLQAATSTTTCDVACQKDVDIMWRIILGFSAIPGSFALYYRLTIPETPRYTFDVKHNIVKAVADSDRKGSAPIMEFYRYFKDWKQFRVLFGTVTSWFLLAVTFYGLNLNT